MKDRRGWQLANALAVGAVTLTVTLAGCRGEPTQPSATPEQVTAQAELTRVPLQFLQVSTGSDKGCGVSTDHRAYCWRAGEWRPDPNDRPFIAYPVPGGLSFSQVAVGGTDDHVCGITTDSLAYCWGDNDYGQLGDGTLQPSNVPVPVAGGRRFRSITAGYKFTCARNLYNRAFCWGQNYYGEIGNEAGAFPNTPERVHTTETFASVAAGLEHVCAVAAEGRAYCWGRDSENQLGDGTTAHRSDSVPTPVVGSRLYKQVSAAVDHSCALSTTGVAFCWGMAGTIGDGLQEDRNVPTRVAGNLKFSQISANWDHTCALTFDRQTYCWGSQFIGMENSGVPVAILTDYPFTQISTGEHMGCGIRANGSTWCWPVYTDDRQPRLIHGVR
jgi:alpha-tubulin suppressor-like RCC1 family protein